MIRLILAISVGIFLGILGIKLTVDVAEFTKDMQTRFVKPTKIMGDH